MVTLCSAAIGSDYIQARAIGIPSGDELLLMKGTEVERAYLAFIDAPELAQPFGKEAQKLLSRYCYMKNVEIEFFNKVGKKLYVLIHVDGKVMNYELVKAGLAWTIQNEELPRKYDTAENRARINEEGLWADKNPSPPWEYRSRRAQSHAPDEPVLPGTAYREQVIKMNQFNKADTDPAAQKEQYMDEKSKTLEQLKKQGLDLLEMEDDEIDLF